MTRVAPKSRPDLRYRRITLIGLFCIATSILVAAFFIRATSTVPRVVLEIESMGGEVDVEPHGPDWVRSLVGRDREDHSRVGPMDKILRVEVGVRPGGATSFSRPTDVHDDWLAQLSGQDSLVELGLTGTQVTDAGIASLQGLDSLRCLRLAHTQISDDALRHLRDFASLEELDLTYTKITDEGLAYVSQMDSLRRLKLLGVTTISDAGLQHLAEAKSLEWLDLRNTPITDAGVKHLRRMTALRDLFLHGTAISNQGIAELRDALPAW